MKKIILTFVAAIAFSLGAAAQTTQYVMQIKKTNGEIIPVYADEIENVSFVSSNANMRTLMLQGIKGATQSLAERINLTGLKTLTGANHQLLQAIQNTPAFVATIKTMFELVAAANTKKVEEGNPLAQYGFETYSVLTPELLRYRAELKGDENFKISVADAMEFVFPATLPSTSQIVDMTLSIKSVGESMQTVIPSVKDPKKAMVYYIPEKFEMTMSANVGGQEVTVFTGELNFTATKAIPASPYVNLLTDSFGVSGKFESHIKNFEQYGLKDDENTISFGFGLDMANKKLNTNFGFVQAGAPLIGIECTTSFTERPALLSMLLSGDIRQVFENIDLISTMSSGSSLIDLVASFASGRSLDKLSINFLDRMVINVSCSDNLAFLQAFRNMVNAHRDRKSKEEVDVFTQRMNELLTIGVKVVNPQIPDMAMPVIIQTEKFGVDYVALPAIRFLDEQDFTPVTSLVETETVKYTINIASHSVKPVSEAVTTVIGMVSTVFNVIFGGEQTAQQSE